MSNQTFPSGPTPAEELEAIAARFPLTSRRGYVSGWYCDDGSHKRGPFPTEDEARGHVGEAGARMGWTRIIVGPVFTSRGTLVKRA